MYVISEFGHNGSSVDENRGCQSVARGVVPCNGIAEGNSVGAIDGDGVSSDDALVGSSFAIGESDGLNVGDEEGLFDGDSVGYSVGGTEGTFDGDWDGIF